MGLHSTLHTRPVTKARHSKAVWELGFEDTACANPVVDASRI